MSDLPEPLVSADVDLRDFDYIPLYGDRLFNSDTWALCDADEKVAALRLWWRAWHEEPAGSLPNNDRLLAERAGYGVAVKAFLAIKENAMRGWTLCSDGRLYHPVVASIALDVWRTKKKKKAENAADRERKRLKRLAGHPAETEKCPEDKTEIPPDIQSENPLKGKGRDKEVSGTDVPDGGAPSRASDPIKEIWDRGLAILGKERRSLLGKYRQSYGDPIVLAAIVECENEMPSEPAAYFIACCERRKSNGNRRSHAEQISDLGEWARRTDERESVRGDYEAAG